MTFLNFQARIRCDRKGFFSFTKLLLCLHLLPILFTDLSGQDSAPNIVVIVMDDVGYGETSLQGNEEIPTPNIDRIAKNGIQFTNGYVTASYCSPSRAGLLTGRHQNRFGYTFNPTGYLNEDPLMGLPLEEKTIPELLLDAGYVSAVVGKWHLGGSPKFHPFHHGFDEFFGFRHEGHYYAPFPYEGATTMLRRKVLPGGGSGRWTSADGRLIYHTKMGHNEPDYDANNPLVRGSQPVNEKAFLTDAFTREAIQFIDRNSDKPFFLYLTYNAVHSPLQSNNEYTDRFAHITDIQRRIFAGMLSNLDVGIGQVLDKLTQEDLIDNTLIFCLSDNGGPTKELTSSNAPLKGGKGTLYEGGIRVPFVAQWPNGLPQGIIYEEPVSALDILPTLLASVGHPIPDNLDGINLLPYLTGLNKSKPHDLLYWETNNFSALRKGDWKLVRAKRGNRTWQLYDLGQDISETENLAELEPAKRDELLAQWYAKHAEIK